MKRVAMFALVATLALPLALIAQNDTVQDQPSQEQTVQDQAAQPATMQQEPPAVAAPASPVAEPAGPAVAVNPGTTVIDTTFLDNLKNKTNYSKNPYWAPRSQEDWMYIQSNGSGQ